MSWLVVQEQGAGLCPGLNVVKRITVISVASNIPFTKTLPTFLMSSCQELKCESTNFVAIQIFENKSILKSAVFSWNAQNGVRKTYEQGELSDFQVLNSTGRRPFDACAYILDSALLQWHMQKVILKKGL